MVILAILIGMAFSSGCVNKLFAHDTGDAQAGFLASSPNSTEMGVPPSLSGTIPDPLQQDPVVKMTPAKSEIVTAVAPILTPDPYPVIHGTRINETPYRLDRVVEFGQKYTLDGNATGLLVNVVEAPLYIVYYVRPKYDCLGNPESCRGTATATVNRPSLLLTVRDNQTQEIVGKNGYGGVYSSAGSGYIAIYRAGMYHLTIEGNFLEVKILIATGASPSRLDIGDGDTSDWGTIRQENEWK